ncbi:MAG: type II toxin-antitoxin system PemK/MazF family toxin, partial [Dehalococcoidia bacterium]
MRRGEVWWADAGAGRVRPVVLVSRETAYVARQLLLVAPVTTRIRSIPSEVPLHEPEGLDRPSVANCDVITPISKGMLLRRAGTLSPSRVVDLDA